MVGLREGSSWKKAEASGLKVMPVADAVKASDVIMILAPDEAQAAIYRQDIAPNLKPGSYLAFGHGFNIHFGQIVPPADVNVFMVAPKGPGHLVRSEYTERQRSPLSVGRASGSQRQHSPSRFGLCQRGGRRTGRHHRDEFQRRDGNGFIWRAGGLVRRVDLVDPGWVRDTGRGRVLAGNGLLRVFHEVKLIVDLIYQGGIANMRYSISTTAKYGDITVVRAW